MQTFPVAWHRRVEFVQLGRLDEVSRNTTHVHIGTHSGTHLDAPSHFIAEGETISDFALGRFSANARLVDLTDVSPGEEVGVTSFSPLMDRPPEPLGAILLNFNWSRFYGTPGYYSDQPFVSEAAMKFLCSLKPSIIGYDLAMPDNPLDGFGAECDSPMHKLALGQGILLLENLTFPSSVPDEFQLFAFPLNLKGLDGSPVRAVGRVIA